MREKKRIIRQRRSGRIWKKISQNLLHWEVEGTDVTTFLEALSIPTVLLVLRVLEIHTILLEVPAFLWRSQNA